MNLFYHPNAQPIDAEINFDKDESRHIGKVLRKKAGDVIHLTNGKGFFFETELTLVNAKKCTGTINKVEKQTPLPYKLHIAVAPTKLNDRYEWFLEKATEIGITEITPIICDHSERKIIKPERYEKILQSAMKQSLKAYLPILNPAVTYSEFIKNNASEKITKCIAHCEDEQKQFLKSIIKANEQYIICIGPEGDFSVSEIELALKNNFIPTSLGNSRLRTETAAIVACHTVSLINEN